MWGRGVRVGTWWGGGVGGVAAEGGVGVRTGVSVGVKPERGGINSAQGEPILYAQKGRWNSAQREPLLYDQKGVGGIGPRGSPYGKTRRGRGNTGTRGSLLKNRIAGHLNVCCWYLIIHILSAE